MNHGRERPPNVIHLILRRSKNLNQRRRVTGTHRLPRLILPIPPTRTPMIRTIPHITRPSPPTKQRRPTRSNSNMTRRQRALTSLLRSNNNRPAIRKRLIQRRIIRIKHGIIPNTPMIRSTPILPIILHKRLPPLKPIRHPAMLLNPRIHQRPQRRKIHHPHTITVQQSTSSGASHHHHQTPPHHDETPAPQPHPSQPPTHSHATQPASTQPDPPTDATEPSTAPKATPQTPHTPQTHAHTTQSSTTATAPTADTTHSPAAPATPTPTPQPHAPKHQATETPAPPPHTPQATHQTSTHAAQTAQNADPAQAQTGYAHHHAPPLIHPPTPR